jgi:hypothetical protein
MDTDTRRLTVDYVNGEKLFPFVLELLSHFELVFRALEAISAVEINRFESQINGAQPHFDFRPTMNN